MKFGLIAERVGHSFSAEIHKKLFGYDYELRAVARDEFDSFMKNRDFTAINVTIPYKEAVIPYLDYVNDTAREIGAVNTVVNRDGKLYGYNTDISGLVTMIEKTGIELKDKKVLVLGSGGTSNTAFYASKMLGCSSVFRVSRSGKGDCITYEEAMQDHSDADVIINTTPCGMFPDIGKSAVDVGTFPNLSGVVDVVYNPLRPKLVCDARARGIKSTGGLYMLVAQAAYAAEKFIGSKADESKIEEIYRDMFFDKENIVLVGMPGSGKTTVGKILAERLGRELLDVDRVITDRYGRPPHEIIRDDGEKAFRDIESETVRELSKQQGKIIATGGGTVIRSENVSLLRENGRVYFLDRNLDDIVPTTDRPLSSTRADLEKRYNERLGFYLSASDCRISCADTAQKTADLVLEELK